jgi:3-deoxy-D-manno-octulosonate 8-phosphate phosphatase (KDO 8-P phosphatase)
MMGMEEAAEKAKKIKMVILDVDGVMTDGNIGIGDDGVRHRVFYQKDGFATIALQMSGIEVAVMIAGYSAAIEHRAQDLRIKRLYKSPKKLEKYQEILEETGLDEEEVCYIGDDLLDVPLLKRVGFPVVPADAAPEAKEVAHYITATPGGKGVVREVAELILKSQGKWDTILDKILDTL